MTVSESFEKQNKFQKILIVRADRMGDVILSTPSFESVESHFPTAQITYWVHPRLYSILNPSTDRRKYFWPEEAKSVFQWASELKSMRFDAVLMLQYQPKIAWACFLAGIAYRYGPLSKLSSRMTLNRGLRQKRSQVLFHEAQYNLALSSFFIGKEIDLKESTRVSLKNESLEISKNLLEKLELDQKRFVVIHPGMGGSALNWPIENYVKLSESLVSQNKDVLVTLGPQDEALEEKFKSIGVKICFPHRHGDLGVMGGVIRSAKAVIAPSTGPLHLAVALNRDVVSFFPEIRVQSAKRWGPYCPSAQAQVFGIDARVDDVLADLNSLLDHEKIPSQSGQSPEASL